MSEAENDSSELPPSLRNDHVDHIAAAIRSLAGAAPWIGGLLAELVNYAIPNQRVERIAKFAAELEKQLAGMERDVLKARFSSPGYIDLLEDGMHQAVRALSEERIQYIASIVKNGLTDEEEELDRYKHLMVLLASLNDTEVIILKSYDFMGPQATDFFETHGDTLAAQPAVLGSSQSEVDRSVIHQDYRQHLVRLNLLAPSFRPTPKGEVPEFDSKTGLPKSNRYKITPLGSLLLRAADLSEVDEH